MNTQSVRVSQGVRRLSKRNARRFRQAAARRRLQELQDEKVLQSWLTEVWDEPASLIENDPSIILTTDRYHEARQGPAMI